VTSWLAFHVQLVLTDTLLSAVVLISHDLHRAVVDRYDLRDNLRYACVHTSTGDNLPSTGFFFLPPPNRRFRCCSKTASFDDAPSLINTTAKKRDVEYPGRFSCTSTMAHSGDNSRYGCLEQGFKSVTILLAKYLAGSLFHLAHRRLCQISTAHRLQAPRTASRYPHSQRGRIQRGDKKCNVDGCYASQ